MEGESTVASGSKGAKVRSISEHSRAANRKNAQRSTGPKTEAGKARSRGNAIKHGFFVQEMSLQRWCFREDFRKAERWFQELVDHYQPVGPVEKTLVEMIAECCWKMRRLQIAESASVKLDIGREQEHFRASQSGEKDQLFMIGGLFDEAEKRADGLGYVDDDLVATILKEPVADDRLKTDFLLANQKARALAKEPADDSNLSEHRAMKRVQSALRRKLRALKESCWKMEVVLEKYDDWRQEPHYEQHLLPDSRFLDNLLRYQTAIDRRLYRAIAELERLQRQRLGDSGAPQSLKPAI
jgi:hypothetical protein